MKKNKLMHYVRSLVLLPVMSMSLLGSMGNTHSEITNSLLVKKVNIVESEAVVADQVTDPMIQQKVKAEAIDTYFAERNMPLKGTGMKMVLEAEKNGFDWRLLPAISVRESTGGKHDCQKVDHNAFGWGSCKIGFKSDEQAIETVARNLGGNNPKTAYHYDGKTTIEILHSYNPPSVIPKYAEQVISIMNVIGDEDTKTADLAIVVNI